MMSLPRHPAVQLLAVLLALVGLHALTARDSEPFFNNDETRHTMTGVFVADALRDLPLSDPKGYAIRYYCQYPGVGIITWPPLFYVVEGAAMLAFGPHFLVGRACVAAFAVLALVYVYRFARVQLSHGLSLLAVALVGLTPAVFVYTQRVMLEVPTFAVLLVSVTHFEKYLTGRRGRDAILACLFAAFAALTRFDGVLLAVYFALRLLMTRNLGLLLKRPVIAGALLAVLLAAPYYLLTWKLYSSGLSGGTHPESNALGTLNVVAYYLLTLPNQAGWGLAVVAPLGLLVCLARFRRESGPAFALLAAVYLFFTPLAELEWRHAIYWLPAVAVLACRLVQVVFERCGRSAGVAFVLLLLAAGVFEAQRQAFRFVFGYEGAARWVLANRTTDRPVLIDGELPAAFIYQVRKNDPARGLWVLRGDKLLYAMFSDPNSRYTQYANTEAEVLDRLERADPEFVVLEDPSPDFHTVPGAELLRAALKKHPERYAVAETFPLRTNYDHFTDVGTQLVVYRKLHRNPNAAKTVEVEVFGLGQTLGATRP